MPTGAVSTLFSRKCLFLLHRCGLVGRGFWLAILSTELSRHKEDESWDRTSDNKRGIHIYALMGSEMLSLE
jgi:hypothetical protein